MISDIAYAYACMLMSRPMQIYKIELDGFLIKKYAPKFEWKRDSNLGGSLCLISPPTQSIELNSLRMLKPHLEEKPRHDRHAFARTIKI